MILRLLLAIVIVRMHYILTELVSTNLLRLEALAPELCHMRDDSPWNQPSELRAASTVGFSVLKGILI